MHLQFTGQIPRPTILVWQLHVPTVQELGYSILVSLKNNPATHHKDTLMQTTVHECMVLAHHKAMRHRMDMQHMINCNQCTETHHLETTCTTAFHNRLGMVHQWGGWCLHLEWEG